MRGIVARLSGFFPRGVFDACWQFLLFFLAYNAYQVVRGITDGGREVAFANAERVIDVERSLGSYFEAGFQKALIDHASVLVDFANFMYLNSHFVITTGFLAWLYLFRNDNFYFVRNMFMVSMGLALVGYLAYPTAPPRFLPEWGFTDTVASFVGEAAENSANVLYNPFAAVPSMHVAFALMIAIPAFMLVRNRVLKALWAVYPLVVTFVVMVTANHYWLDAALGALVAAMSAYAASFGFARLRPEAWAWRTGARAPA